MKKDKRLKKIAAILAQSDDIASEVIELLQKNLTKAELKKLAKMFRLEVKKRSVYVSSSSELNVEQKKTIEKTYAPQSVYFETDGELGGGIRIINQDTVLDMSIKHYIITMVQNLSNS